MTLLANELLPWALGALLGMGLALGVRLRRSPAPQQEARLVVVIVACERGDDDTTTTNNMKPKGQKHT